MHVYVCVLVTLYVSTGLFVCMSQASAFLIHVYVCVHVLASLYVSTGLSFSVSHLIFVPYASVCQCAG